MSKKRRKSRLYQIVGQTIITLQCKSWVNNLQSSHLIMKKLLVKVLKRLIRTMIVTLTATKCNQWCRSINKVQINHKSLVRGNMMEPEPVALKYLQRGKTYISKITVRQHTHKTTAWIVSHNPNKVRLLLSLNYNSLKNKRKLLAATN